ncbi:MAG: hypothetical protein KJ936_06150 [Proteobacteria bacterium]|nr:hypothetical protein [Pseudomonadota bacterium]
MMRILLISIGCFLCFITATFSVAAETQWGVGLSGGSEGITGFNLSVGNYYRVPEREVLIVRDRGIHQEELPVVYFLAQRARVSPEAVVDLRLRGMNWMDITLKFGLSPDIYYVPVKSAKEGPPYGNAYGYYKKHPKKEWKKMKFKDEDIVNQVNLKFISEHHKYTPEQVMKYRSEGRSFVDIDRDVRSEKQRKGKHKDKDRKEKRSRGKGGKSENN